MHGFEIMIVLRKPMSEATAHTYDVVVIGGGVSGCSAAVAAARCGKSVALVERSDMLGGMATLALVNPLQTFHAPHGQVIRGLGQELVDRLVARKACPGHLMDPIGFANTVTPVDPEAFGLELRAMCREASVTVFLNHRFRDCALNANKRLKSVSLTDENQRTATLCARAFVDAGGNGDLTLVAGCDMEMDPDHQPMTLIFVMGGVDPGAIIRFQKQNPQDFYMHQDPGVLDRGYVAVSGFFSQVAEARKSGELTIPRDRLLFFNNTHRDEVVVNTTRITGLSGLDENELATARARGMAQVNELVPFMQKHIAGFENAFLKTVAREPGVRETRRLIGRYVLHENELIESRNFDDVIAKGAYPLDIHQQTDEGLKTLSLCGKKHYDIPLRSILNKTVPNLITVGKCMSVTHQGFSSTRVMPTCLAVGQAGGVAAALAADDPAGDIQDQAKAIQDILLAQNAILFDEQVV